ncbi:MAG: thioredoxin family protein [Acetobacteraceae bacterium]|jgi:thiol-disulfide isomerase/thioredoxin
MRRRFLILAALLAGSTLVAPARAADVTPYDQGAFAAAEAAGKPILVAIHASWCPVCAKQRPILSQLEQQPAFKDLVVFMVDFDSQKNVVAAMGARKQSTLIVFHGNVEKGRSVGDTNAATIQELLAKSMA